MYLLIIFIPLLSTIITGFFGKLLTKEGTTRLASSSILITCLISYFIFYEVCYCDCPCYITLSPWIIAGSFKLYWDFVFDSLTVIMLVVVLTISTVVHIYSISYMSHDPHINRFMSYLSLFTFFMIILVTANNYIQMFVGWEGVGLCSYLLINFWYTRIQANKAAIKAMLVNRVGDINIIFAIVTIFFVFKSVDYSTVFALAYNFVNSTINIFNYNIPVLNLICIFIFIGAVGKSAQVGLHVWLPDAMEGPTPVSALIHAATMVTAGIFVICRSSFIFEYAPIALTIVTIIGAITTFYAASIGLVQNDLKKVIAYSTCSQLGYMIFACGISGYNISIYHLANHAFFKALLFLSAGSVIHAMNDEQDMRKMGGLLKILPFTYAMFLIGSFALLGFPFLSGYYSKDLILELSFATFTIPGHFAYILGTFAAFFTAFYSIRLLILTFITKTNAYKQIINKAHDAPLLLGLPLLILSIFSIFIGYFSKDMIVGLGSTFWGNSLNILFENNQMIDAEFLPFIIKIFPILSATSGLILACLLYTNFTKYLNYLTKNNLFRNIYLFLNKKWFIDKLYSEVIYQKILYISYNPLYSVFDKGIYNILGPRLLTNLLEKLSKNSSEIQSGFFYHYALIFLISLTLIIILSSLNFFNIFIILFVIFFFIFKNYNK
nr:NADH dehydrogenase subunit 5 [Blastocystis sp. subtype 6]